MKRAAVRPDKKPIASRSFRLFTLVPAALAGWLGSDVLAADALDESTATRQVCRTGLTADVAHAQRDIGQAEVAGAGLLANPSVLIQDQRTLSGPTERETILGLTIPFSLSGRRSLLVDAAKARREEAAAESRATLFEAALAFRGAYLAAQLDQAEVGVLERQQTALEALEATIQALSRRGEAAGNDLLRQSTQTQLHRARLEAARARAQAARARLTAWIDGEIVLPVFEPAHLDGGAPTGHSAPEVVPSRVQSLEASSRASALEAQAARRRWFPDPEVFAGYREISAGGEVGRGLSLSLSLPLTFFDHGQGEAARADAQQQLARAGASKLRRENKAEVDAAAAQFAHLLTAVTVVDRASSNAEALETQAQRLYAAGESSITELLETFRQAEDARLTQLDLARQVGASRLALMHAAGTMFDPTLDADCGGAAR